MNMSAERQRRIFEIADQAQELSAAQRTDFLDTACGSDAPLRAEVESLLETTKSAGVLHRPAFSVHAEDDAIGRRIGHYELVELLDRGGMGTVYRAQRDDFEKQVALKLIRRGLDADPDLVRRFHNERQILARLEHPHIAHLLDGDTTEDQLPYFVMELVEGQPIDRYCEGRQLSIEDRLELVRKVCSAVHFAHQNLVIHRDLKPDNILITDDSQPKLLDFGIAKLLDDSLAAQPLNTVTGQAPMTPRYASPEQVRRQSITTASDTYSLGVLLYELLTGVDPYGAQGRRPDEISRAICEEEPPRPSTAVKQRPDQATPQARKLRHRLSGDLDSIILKAMRKEPAQRYRSAEELSQDIANHLAGLPVAARAGTFRYRASKFVRRHWRPLLVAMAFFALVTGFGIISNELRQKAEEQRNFAEEQRAEAEEQKKLANDTREFFENIFEEVDPTRGQEANLSARDLLQIAKKRAVEKKNPPELQVEILASLGRTFQNLGESEEALEVLEQCLEIATEYYGSTHSEVATCSNNLASRTFDAEDYSDAEGIFRRVLSIRREIGQSGPSLWITESNLASTLTRQGDFLEAEDLFQKMRNGRLERYGPTHSNLFASYINMGTFYIAKGNPQRALDEANRASKILGTQSEPKDEDRASLRRLEGSALTALGKPEEARRHFEEALELRQQRYAPGHKKISTAQKNLASTLLYQGPERAKNLLDEALSTFIAILPTSWRVAEVQSLQGELLTLEGQFQDAEPLLLTSYARLAEVRGENSYPAVVAIDRLIRLYDAWEKLEEAQHWRERRPSLPLYDPKETTP